jgi:CBS domain containing-hemolysin-like protein
MMEQTTAYKALERFKKRVYAFVSDEYVFQGDNLNDILEALVGMR